MPRFLIDVNLPYRLAFWSGGDCSHMRDLGETWTDTQIWEYARERDMVIVSRHGDRIEGYGFLGSNGGEFSAATGYSHSYRKHADA
ncbi:MAG: DUF5615 family PIN-like protein [Thiohalocapsa sp.]